MKRTKINEIEGLESAGKQILIKGWVRTKRDSKGFSFITINDGSNFHGVQVIADEKLPNYEDIKKVTTGSSLAIEGKVVDSPGQQQKYELQAISVEIYGFADPETYPIQKKKMTLEYLRDYAHLRPRTNTYAAVFKIRHSLAFAIHKFFNDRGFYYIHTPIITSADAEGAGELFHVTNFDLNKIPKRKDGHVNFEDDFFGRETHLTVSGQLALENFCSAIGDVYTFGPTFRAENSNTTRHLAEFWMIEPEIAFADLEDNMQLAEDFVKYIIRYIMDTHSDELQFLNKMYDQQLLERLNFVCDNAFERITYSHAIDILLAAKKSFEFPVNWGSDLQSEHERYLCEEHFKKPVIVTDYPKEIKAFYMKQNPDGKTVRAMDVLFPGIGEIIGGSQREDNFDALKKRMDELEMPEADYGWYLDLRRFGTHPHAGFGLGFERMIQFIAGMTNIKDVIPFPRFPKHAEF
ncbi:MAG: asparagine--tRNA ligase [Calditrichaeota bacterium]|nr:asparagine--tRNA ligase [Calditrichota bacterium]